MKTKQSNTTAISSHKSQMRNCGQEITLTEN